MEPSGLSVWKIDGVIHLFSVSILRYGIGEGLEDVRFENKPASNIDTSDFVRSILEANVSLDRCSRSQVRNLDNIRT